MDNAEKKLPVRNLKRISEKKFNSYEDAKSHQQKVVAADGPAPAKVKIFARYDGTFDVVGYEKIQKEPAKIGAALAAVNALTELVEKKYPVHGQKSKDRKKDPRKK
jgi:hypothetical protein